MGKFGKSIAAFLYLVAATAIPLFTGDGRIDPVEWSIIGTAVVTNAGVYLVPLAPRYGWAKTAVGALTAGLAVVEVVILDHVIDANEALMVAAAVLGALGIAVAPAESGNGVDVGWGSDRTSRVRH